MIEVEGNITEGRRSHGPSKRGVKNKTRPGKKKISRRSEEKRNLARGGARNLAAQTK